MYHTYNSPITLVVHSMGGPISLYFLTQFVDQAWKDTYIKQYITISAVWAGSLKSVRSLISGDNEGIFIDKPIWGRPSQRTFQSTYFLLPPPGDVWDNKTILVYTPNGQYTAYDYQKLFTSLNYTLGWEFYQMISDPTTRFPPPNVTTYCYYGLGLDTLKELHYSVSNYPDSPPNVSTCDGDGTVPYMSLKVCERWKTQQSYKVHSQSFQNAEHVKILKTPQVIQTVANLIKSS
jgi:lysophospholipase-3